MAFVHCRLDQLKGTDPQYANQRATYQLAYDRAKQAFDAHVAFEIVERCSTNDTLDRLADVACELRQEPIYVFPYLGFDDEDGALVHLAGTKPTNALPFAYAAFLAEKLGGSVNDSIFQAARVGRTNLPKWLRFLCQPSFEGAVDRRRPYILVDDVMSTGGTLAALRSYIAMHGGTVAATTVLANKEGIHQKFAIADQTLGVLRSTYGPELDGYWIETFGHEIHTLTETEAEFLALYAREQGGAPSRAELLLSLRERVNKAAAQGR